MSNEDVGGVGSSSVHALGQPNMEEGRLENLEMAPNTSGGNIGHNRDDEFDSGNTKSCSENQEATASGDDHDPQSKRRRRYHRHTAAQIQEMENFFRDCPHPDDKQRKELGRELGLDPLQVKFWFQNKRTQLKTQQERYENTQLKNIKERLKAENIKYREALKNASCPKCGGHTAIAEMSVEEHQLRLENTRLKEEIQQMSGMAAKYIGKSTDNNFLPSPPMPLRPLELGAENLGGQPEMGGEIHGAEDMIRSISAIAEADKPMIIKLAIAAMEELIMMTQLREPLWMSSSDGLSLILNEEEYIRTFPQGIGPRPLGFRSEASRESAVVIMNHISLVEHLMDVNQWCTLFPSIVSRATTIEILSTGVAGSYNGALLVLNAEFQLPTPLIPTREFHFVRYCKQQADGVWAIVDVCIDHCLPGLVIKNRKRPSGCLIQGMPNGQSKVTWVEHVEVDDSDVPNLYVQLVNSGNAFGAKRWVATLERQCERLASAMANNIPTAEIGVITNQQGRKSLLKMAERMVISFSPAISASRTISWTALSGTGVDDIKVMSRQSLGDPGMPPGLFLTVATSLWLPTSPNKVFDFLRNENFRNEWDILSNGGAVQEMAHIANGRNSGNYVSLLRVISANSNQSNMLVLQQTCTDPTGSFIIYAPVDIVAMNVVLNGGDPDYVALLPSGFTILPDGTGGGLGESGVTSRSLLTVALQILVDSNPTAKLSLSSVANATNLITSTVMRIQGSLS